jgi:hypothetical protein
VIDLAIELFLQEAKNVESFFDASHELRKNLYDLLL